MDKANEDIVRAFNENATTYFEVFAIVIESWEDQLHRPLHVVGFYLNLGFLYDNSQHIQTNTVIMIGLYKVIEKIMFAENQDKVDKQLDIQACIVSFQHGDSQENKKKKTLGNFL